MGDNRSTLDMEWQEVGFHALFGEVATPGTPENVEDAEAMLREDLFRSWREGWVKAEYYRLAMKLGRARDGAH